MTKIAIIGTTSWGTTLGIMLGQRKMEVALWARTEEEARKLNKDRENTAFVPGIPFPQDLTVTSSIPEALSGAALCILAVPSQSMRHNAKLIRDYVEESTMIMSVAKGLELVTTKRMSVVISEEIAPRFHPNICVLSGPNLSREIARGLLAATVVAANDAEGAKRAQEILMSPIFRVYISTDVIGVELGGALKNIIALGAGIGDGLGYGDNAKATFITRGLAEITRLGVVAGASPLTFAGLVGLGDLVATCSSPLSRNRFVGEQLAKGRPLKEITASMRSIAEGINTTIVARQMAKELKVEMPITEQMYRVLFEGLDPRHAASELMTREAKAELAGISL